MTDTIRPDSAPADSAQPSPGDAAEADRALKAKHRAMWASGDYPALAEEHIAELGEVLVAAAGVQPGARVLDVAAGSGNAAIHAARAGGSVVATDLTPELFEAGRRAAAAAAVELEWREADAEALPFDDGEFDVVLSCVGVMFAPHHERSAAELLRVARPGATIALLSWTPEGFIGEMFGIMKRYSPPPPPGAQPPPLWGSEQHVRGLLGAEVTDLTAERRTIEMSGFGSPRGFLDYFRSHYGPTISVYRHIAADADRVAALDAELTELARSHGRGSDPLTMDWEYLLVTARRAG